MLSLASSDDGSLVFAGSLSSGLWISEDGSESWVQLAWEQPAPDQFGVPGALGGCCIPSIAVGPESARWLVERNPLFLADVTGDGKADIIGFGDAGVWTAIGNGDGTFQAPQVALNDFCIQAGGGKSTGTRASWPTSPVTARPTSSASAMPGSGPREATGTDVPNAGVRARRPRLRPGLAGRTGTRASWPTSPVTARPTSSASAMPGSGRARSNGDGTFQDAGVRARRLRLRPGAGGSTSTRASWPTSTGDGKADIVGFGDAGVWTARSNGDGTFADAGVRARRPRLRPGLAGRQAPALPGRRHR